MLNTWIDHIIRNRSKYAMSVLFLFVVLIVFTRIPTIDGKLTGLNIESTKYYKSGKKIANFFNMSEFIEIKVSPSDSGTRTIFNSLDVLESNLHATFDNIDVKSIHLARKFYTNEIDSNLIIQPTLQKASRTPILQDLISHDEKSFLLVIKLDSLSNINLAKLDSLISLPYPGIENLKCMSIFHVERQIARSLERDILTICLIVFILIAGLVLYIYRTVKALLYSSIIIVTALIPMFFFFTVFNIQLNLITALSIPVVLILSLADSIHLLTGFFNSGKNASTDRIEESMKSYIVPSFFTSVTTTIAFASFLLNSAESIKDFGLVIALSVMPAFFFSYALSPYLLEFFKIKTLPDHGVKSLLRFFTLHRKKVSLLLVVLALVSLPMLFNLSFKTDFDSFIPEGSEVEANRAELSADFDSQLGLSVLIEKDSTTTTKKAKQIEGDIVSMVNSLSGISTIGSIKSIKNQLDFKESYGIAGQFIHFPSKDNPYKSKNGKVYRVDIRFLDLEDLEESKAEIEKLFEPFKEDYIFTFYSKALLVNEINQSVAKSLFISLLFSFVFVFGCILILTKSLLTTFVSVLVNIVPLSTIAVVYYFAGYSLNILTSITTVVCLGIMVDDTIHVVYRKTILKKDNEELGFGIVTTSMVLVVGFLTFLFSSFEPCQEFGVVSATVFLITMIADLTMLPYLLDLVRINSSSSPFGNANH